MEQHGFPGLAGHRAFAFALLVVGTPTPRPQLPYAVRRRPIAASRTAPKNSVRCSESSCDSSGAISARKGSLRIAATSSSRRLRASRTRFRTSTPRARASRSSGANPAPVLPPAIRRRRCWAQAGSSPVVELIERVPRNREVCGSACKGSCWFYTASAGSIHTAPLRVFPRRLRM